LPCHELPLFRNTPVVILWPVAPLGFRRVIENATGNNPYCDDHRSGMVDPQENQYMEPQYEFFDNLSGILSSPLMKRAFYISRRLNFSSLLIALKRET
jgi:hypothetical protein